MNTTRTNQPDHPWQMQAAKQRFSEVVKRAMAGQPQLVTKRGEPAVFVVSVDQFEQNTPASPSKKAVLLNRPHKDIELDLRRATEAGRDIDL